MPRKKLIVFAGSMDGGGSEQQTLLLLKWLDRQSWEPELWLLYKRGVLLERVPQDVPMRAYWSEHTAPRFYVPGRIHRQQIAWVRKLLRSMTPATLYDRTFHATLITGPATEGLPVHRVSTITSPPDQELIGSRERWARLKRWRLAHAYRTAGAVVAVSEAAARSAELFYRLPAGSVQVVPNPVDLAAVQAAAQLPPPEPLESGCFHIASVGRMTIEKGHHVLLDALALVSQRMPRAAWHLWLAGDGPLRAALQAQADALGLSRRVTFLGHIADAPRLMARCQLLCLPSLYEGLPNVAMEAMALGVPLVATAAGGTIELVDSGKLARLVPPGDAAALSIALQEALIDPTAGVLRAAAARKAIAARDLGHVLPRLELLLDRSAR